MAVELGKRLLAEVEEVGFDEILSTLRLRLDPNKSYFGLKFIDDLLEALLESRPPTSKTYGVQPVIEISSPGPGGGKRHLLYHLITIAILPTAYKGRQACVAILDTDNNFSVPRLAQQLDFNLTHHDSALSPTEEHKIISTALQHVHIFRPQTLASTVATLLALPSYLFHGQHISHTRNLAFIALTSASAFYWQTKAEEENAAFEAKTTTTPNPTANTPALATYSQLTAALRSASRTLNSPLIFTTWNLSPPPKPQDNNNNPSDSNSSSLRPSLPIPLATLPTLRLLVRRLPVRKLAPMISVQEALRETAERQRAVDENRFECTVNEWGMDPRTLAQIRRMGSGFGFRVREEGFVIEQDRHEGEKTGEVAGE